MEIKMEKKTGRITKVLVCMLAVFCFFAISDFFLALCIER